MAAVSGLCISQLLVMPQATVYSAEAGVLTGMLGGVVVEESKAEVVGGFIGNKVEADVFKVLLYSPRLGHE